MHWSDLFNSGASLFIVATASTKTMVPLRILAIATNCILIAYFTVTHAWLPLLLQAFALPLNGWRLYQMVVLDHERARRDPRQAVARLAQAVHVGAALRKGDLLFAKGEAADEMFYTMTGRYVLVELGIEIAPGHLVGELAMLAPDNRRTATLECIEAGEVLSITYEQVEELYYQNPTFGFYFLRFATARLFDNVSRMEGELAKRQAPRAFSGH